MPESPAPPPRPRATLACILLLWAAFYASFTLARPALLDDADSVHAEVAREMLLRHDPITLYANGIRYLEKAPLLYWSMAACLKAFATLHLTSATASTIAVRLPLAFAVLALALVAESFARRLFHSRRAGLYAALILLSSFGIFLFTRITIPDALVCLWITLALWAFWRTEESPTAANTRPFCWTFAAACALNVLTKGLIGIVFPVATIAIYLALSRSLHRAAARLRDLHPWTSLAVFLLLAAPWHILAGLANPTQGHPEPFHFVHGHWVVPLPTDGNVRGWFWFYFINEHLLRYLNLRVPRDYDTVPLALFWGLCLVWLMPWSAFAFKVAGWALPLRNHKWRSQLRRHDLPLRRRGMLLLTVWAAFVLLFFSLSTRQEYYVLPAFPALAILAAGWLAWVDHFRPLRSPRGEKIVVRGVEHDQALELIRAGQAALHATEVLLGLGLLFAAAATWVLLHAHTPAPHTDLASLLSTHPGDYAMSMGHFLDLNAQALGLFRLPLILAALSLVAGPLASLLLRRRARPLYANGALAAGAFGFLLAAHLGLQTFAPVISSAQLAQKIAPILQPNDLLVIHGEYESASTLGFYLHRADIHILEGRSSNLWYGSFFPDAPRLFETPATLAAKWASPQRIFLWQSLTDPLIHLPPNLTPLHVIAQSGGKQLLSNREQ